MTNRQKMQRIAIVTLGMAALAGCDAGGAIEEAPAPAPDPAPAADVTEIQASSETLEATGIARWQIERAADESSTTLGLAGDGHELFRKYVRIQVTDDADVIEVETVLPAHRLVRIVGEQPTVVVDSSDPLLLAMMTRFEADVADSAADGAPYSTCGQCAYHGALCVAAGAGCATCPESVVGCAACPVAAIECFETGCWCSACNDGASDDEAYAVCGP
ncbi:MAG TPA: hypothetical protein VK698_16345 [Kofleriaceae bacterium]|nr:hypothetical protein [Kofleriaceae bacterium]